MRSFQKASTNFQKIQGFFSKLQKKFLLLKKIHFTGRLKDPKLT